MTACLRGLLLLLVWTLGGAFAGAMVVTQQGNQLLIDGAPTALTFARNCTSPAEVPSYRALGFNTLLVRIDSPGSVVLQRARALVDAAQQENLYVLIELANGNWSSGRPAGLSDPDYLEDAQYFLDEIVPEFRDEPNLIGWIISTIEEGALVSDDIGTFGDFLKGKYGTIDRMNAAWSVTTGNGITRRTNLASFTVITEANASQWANQQGEILKLIQADLADYRDLLKARDTDFQHYLMTRYPTVTALNEKWNFQFAAWEKVSVKTVMQREKTMPNSSPVSQLDLAGYFAAVPRRLMDWWAVELLHRDPDHLLFAGGQRSYRTMMTLPPSVNGVFTECYPRNAEPDLDSHNPHAIDIARRGNRFIVLAGIQASQTDPARFAHYLYSGAVHGAAGLGVDDWPALYGSAAHAQVVELALADMRERHLLCRTPAPHIAMVITPFPLGPALANRPLYGYLPKYLYPGPGTLIFTLRKGTCFGQIDYLAPEDLSQISLSRYRVVLLPTVLDFPIDAQLALQRFVAGGGTAVADMGLGTVQANGNNHFLTADMMKLFGVLNAPGLSDVRYNMEVYRPQPRFPRLLPGYRTTGIAGGYTVARAARAIPNGTTDLLFLAVTNSAFSRPVARKREPLAHEPTCGVFINHYGKGFALYAPFPLYHLWTPTSMLFEDFHRDLFSEEAPVALQRPIDFLPVFAEVAHFNDGSVLLWTKDQSKAEAEVQNPVRWAYQVDSGWSAIGERLTRLYTTQPGVQVARPLPIAFSSTAPTLKFAASQVNAQGLLFDVEVVDGHNAPVTVLVSNGEYRVAPSSQHAVTVISATGARQFTTQADAQGIFTFTLSESYCRILISGMDATIEMDKTPPEESPWSGEMPVDVVPAPDF